MPRYARQRTKSDCGPVAVLNIIKWLGYRVSYKNDIQFLKDQCCYTNSEDFAGVRWWNIRAALNRLGNGFIRARKYDVTDLQILQKHVSRGGAFILRHRTSLSDFHYSVVCGAADEAFSWINAPLSTTAVSITPEEFQQLVKSRELFGDTPIALLVSKI